MFIATLVIAAVPSAATATVHTCPSVASFFTLKLEHKQSVRIYNLHHAQKTSNLQRSDSLYRKTDITGKNRLIFTCDSPQSNFLSRKHFPRGKNKPDSACQHFNRPIGIPVRRKRRGFRRRKIASTARERSSPVGREILLRREKADSGRRFSENVGIFLF